MKITRRFESKTIHRKEINKIRENLIPMVQDRMQGMYKKPVEILEGGFQKRNASGYVLYKTIKALNVHQMMDFIEMMGFELSQLHEGRY